VEVPTRFFFSFSAVILSTHSTCSSERTRTQRAQNTRLFKVSALPRGVRCRWGRA
jgi:hypothetical protein